jgi:hypothetical protein
MTRCGIPCLCSSMVLAWADKGVCLFDESEKMNDQMWHIVAHLAVLRHALCASYCLCDLRTMVSVHM